MILIFLVHIAATLFMVGVIWFVQVVHYPLFGFVARSDFAPYHTAHMQRITYVVLPPMLIEAGTAVLLIFVRSNLIPAWDVWLGLILVAISWLSTFFWQLPKHNRLSHGFDPSVHRSLVRSNWLRTCAWSARGLLVLWMVARFIELFQLYF